MKFRNIVFMLLMLLMGLPMFSQQTYTVDVGQFERLKITGNISVVYKNLPDSTGLARYEAPLESGDLFSFNLKADGQLQVEPSDTKWGDNSLPVIYLYSDFLSGVESYSERDVDIVSLAPTANLNINQIGNGTIRVEDLKCNNLSASITTGNGSIYLYGTCVNANFRMVGAGFISADQLKADNVKCRILGTGSIGCWPIDNLQVSGLGTTKIYYKGSPTIKKKGGGKLFELPEDTSAEVTAHD